MVSERNIETIVFRTENLTFMITVVRTSERDACTLLTLMTQIDGHCGARVPSHSVTTWMRLASDLRARCAFDRLTLGAHVQGAAAERGGAVWSRHPGERTGSDGSDGPTRVSHVGKTSV